MVCCKNSPESTWELDGADRHYAEASCAPGWGSGRLPKGASSRNPPLSMPCCQYWRVQPLHPKNSEGDPADGNTCCAMGRRQFPVWMGTDPVLWFYQTHPVHWPLVQCWIRILLQTSPSNQSYQIICSVLFLFTWATCGNVVTNNADGRVLHFVAPAECIDQEPLASLCSPPFCHPMCCPSTLWYFRNGLKTVCVLPRTLE